MGCGASKVVDSTVKPAVVNAPTESIVSSSVESTLSRPTLPSIPKATAFEIPLDNLVRLPKLALPPIDAESKRRVSQQLDNLLGDMEFSQPARRTRKPKLATKERVDPEILKQRLKEKEEMAIKNRELALKKVVNKLARHDDHAKLVLERKKKMQESNEDLPHWDARESEVREEEFESMGYRTASGRSNATDLTASDEVEVVTDPLKVRISNASRTASLGL